MIFNLDTATWQSVNILKRNAPVRDASIYSKYGAPGNLKNNGIYTQFSNGSNNIVIGGEPAPYAPYTETRSRKKGWINKSQLQIVDMILRFDGVTKI